MAHDGPAYLGTIHSNSITPPGIPTSGEAPLPPPDALESTLHKSFFGPNWLRAGWRLLIFVAIIVLLQLIFRFAVTHLSHAGAQPGFSIEGILIGEAAFFFSFLIASWIMARIEGRTVGDYGLPWKKTFGKEFWQGAAIGFAALTILLGTMRTMGIFHFGALALHGAPLARYAALWAVVFLLVGLAEEFSLRGYPQFTLTTGISFWPVAIVLSSAFGALHLGNRGEDWMGALTAGSFGLLACLILRRTGNLWMAIGFHASWDWAETFFYGVPDSGIVAPGHMLNPVFHGPALLTGGSVGPDGSVLCLVVLILCCVFFHIWLRETNYPNPEALGDPRKRA